MQDDYASYAKHIDAPDKVFKWIESRIVPYLKNNRGDQGEIEHIIDYLASTDAPNNITAMTYEQAKKNTEKWTKTLVKRGANIKELESDTEVILDFKDGFKIVKLVGEAAFKREGTLMSNCFRGDTRIITENGTFPIEKLVGRQILLSKKPTSGVASWVEADIKSFGKQRIWEVVIEREGVKRSIFTTGEHRWFVFNATKNKQYRRITEKTTAFLSIGEELPYSHAKRVLFRSESESKGINLSPAGVTHGIVFGDGSVSAKRSARVSLFGFKESLSIWFSDMTPRRDIRTSIGGIELYDLPRNFKLLPDTHESTSYLIGWLAGYFATDGTIDSKGRASISSANIGHLSFAETLCQRFGIKTRGISSEVRLGIHGKKTTLYRLVFEVGAFHDDFFIRSDQRAKNKVREVSAAKWRILSVQPTDTVEEVFCAIVPDIQTFTISGNILTGNCVASYYGRTDTEVYSLRDKDNMPHATMEKDQQVKGKGNGDIHPKYVDYVVKFLEHIGMTVGDSEMQHLGYVNLERFKDELSKDTPYFNGKYVPKTHKLLGNDGKAFASLDLLDVMPLVSDYGTSLRINFELPAFIKLSIEYINKKISATNASSGYYAKNASSGNYATNASSGYYAKNASSGNYATNASSGNYAKNASSGNYAKNASSGYYATNASSGNYAKNASSGNYATNASSGDYAKNASSGNSATNASSGDSATNASSGNYATNASSGDYAKNASSGNSAKNASSGYSAKNASSGNYATNASSGDYAKNASSGNYATNASSGNSAKNEMNGQYSVSVDAGHNGKAKGKIGCWFCLSEWKKDDDIWKPVCVKAVQIDGKIIKEDQWYKLVNGEFVETDDSNE